MSSIVDHFNPNNSASAIITSTRRRSATVSVPEAHTPKSNVHVSVSVSLSESLASISTWAAQIVPGAPPTSPSPRRSSFYSISPKSPARSPKTPRRSSLSATFLTFWDSPSTPPQTPAPKPVSPADLLAQGYTSIFVHLPSEHRNSDYPEPIPESPLPQDKITKTPLFPHVQPRSRTKSVSAEKREEKPSSLTRLRSFSFKAKKSKTSDPMTVFNAPPVPPLPPHKSFAHPSSRQSKKPKSTPLSRYGAVLGPGGGTGALPLAQEIALARILDGGCLDENMRRVTERHAQATGAHTKSSIRDEVFKKSRKDRRPIEKREGLEQEGKLGGGVAGVYRDPQGNLWWDEDESLELAGLLPSSDRLSLSQSGQMPLTGSSVHNQDKEKRKGLLPRLMTSAKPPPKKALPAPSWVPMHSPTATNSGRKGSASDASSPETDDDPDLDPAYAIRPRDSSSLFTPGYSLSAEKERHLRRAPNGIEAFGISPLDSTAPVTENNNNVREKRAKKRPAPLTLPLPLPTPQAPTTGSASTAKTVSRPPTAFSPPPLPTANILNGPSKEESEGRKEFFASAFAPAPDTVGHPSVTAVPSPVFQSSHTKSKMARRSSLSLGLPSFGLGAGGKAGRRTSVASISPSSPMSRVQAPTYSSPHANGPTRGDGNTHLALSKTPSRPSTATGVATERSLKTKASRSRLAGLFRRN